MRLYTLTGATALDDPDHGHFDADEDGGFDLPDQLAARQHAFALNGRRIWETDFERQRRLVAEETDRRKDPATLLAAVESLIQAQSAPAKDAPAVETPAPTRRASKRAAATPPVEQSAPGSQRALSEPPREDASPDRALVGPDEEHDHEPDHQLKHAPHQQDRSDE